MAEETKAEKTEEKTKNKLTSRKFIVWIVATIFYVLACVLGFVAKSAEVAAELFPYWCYVSMLYIGGNVAQDFIFKGKE